MPNYDFKCNVCSHQFSRQVPIKDKNTVFCPQCGGQVSQLFTGFFYAGKGRRGGASGSGCSGGSCNGCSGCG